MKKYAIYSTLFIVICILLGIVITGAIQFARLQDKKNRVLKTFDNHIYCPENTDKKECVLAPNFDLAIPLNQSESYSKEIALYGCNLIGCIESAFKQIPSNLDTLHIPLPTGIEILKKIYYRHTTIGLICQTLDTIWVIFRGSQTIAEWHKDLMIQQVTSDKFNGQVHEGFLKIYDSIQIEIHSYLQQHQSFYNNRYLNICGYSLGGALSQLLLIDSSNSLNFQEKQVYLFGTPRVGNQKFADSLNNQNIYRIKNTADIVCDSPPSVSPNFISDPNHVFLYQHNQKETIQFTINRSSFVENHSIKAYLTFLSL